jgi:imidazolonepropionase-like amidohydrolase
VEPFTVENARVFDGTGLTPPRPVHVDRGRILATPVRGARTVEAGEGVLLPGLIDTHVHVETRAALESCAQWGVTTALDMATPRPRETLPLRHCDGIADLFSAGYPALPPGSGPITAMGYPDHIAVSGPEAVEAFVASRVRDDVDYLKIFIEPAGSSGANAFTPETIAALVRSAHSHGLKAIAHATSAAAYRVAVEAGTDVVTHVPLDAVISEDLARRVQATSPTLVMMQGIQAAIGRGARLPDGYENARLSVRRLHEAGATLLAGTDANGDSSAPFSPPYGQALHQELRLLVDAGLSPVEALRAATVTPAEVFGLADRGVIAVDRRADLLLIDGDPTIDIQATTRIQHVWSGGIQLR